MEFGEDAPSSPSSSSSENEDDGHLQGDSQGNPITKKEKNEKSIVDEYHNEEAKGKDGRMKETNQYSSPPIQVRHSSVPIGVNKASATTPTTKRDKGKEKVVDEDDSSSSSPREYGSQGLRKEKKKENEKEKEKETEDRKSVV